MTDMKLYTIVDGKMVEVELAHYVDMDDYGTTLTTEVVAVNDGKVLSTKEETL